MKVIKNIIEPGYNKPFYRTGDTTIDYSFSCDECGNSIILDSNEQINNSWNGKTNSLSDSDLKFLKHHYKIGLNNKSFDGGLPVFDKLNCSKCSCKYVSYCGVRECSNSAYTITLNGLFKTESAAKTKIEMPELIKITQKQNRELLTEHAKSSYSITWIGKNEWLIAASFVIIGTLILLLTDRIKASGYVFLVIGILELIKYPKRINKWVDKKTKEKIFEKEINFSILDKSLKVSVDNESREVGYNNMRKCLISNTGVLFKISYTEYYYISFSSLDSNISSKEVTEFLKARFDKKRITIKSERK